MRTTARLPRAVRGVDPCATMTRATACLPHPAQAPPVEVAGQAGPARPPTQVDGAAAAAAVGSSAPR